MTGSRRHGVIGGGGGARSRAMRAAMAVAVAVALTLASSASAFMPEKKKFAAVKTVRASNHGGWVGFAV